jgi:hypothetical protein
MITPLRSAPRACQTGPRATTERKTEAVDDAVAEHLDRVREKGRLQQSFIGLV